ncbi:DUF4407 domain-containing protein [Rhodococcus koreensis]
MSADRTPHEPRTADSPIGDSLLWLGGGHANDYAEPGERPTYQVAGLIVLVNGLLAWLVTTVALAAATSWPVLALLPCTVIVGLLVGALARTLAAGRPVRWSGLVGRAAVALFLGAVLGELACVGLLAGSIDRVLEDRAAAVPEVVHSAQTLDGLRDQRAGLDESVRQARSRRDEALVVARCEFNPSPACPPDKITGVPGAGPETRTANELLAGSQQELDDALATRDRDAPGLDTEIARAADGLTAARAAAPSLGARWTAMHEYTVGHTGALLLRLVSFALFAVLSLLPLVLKLWRGETEQDRRDVARAEQQRVDREADTAIAARLAQIRVATETLKAEQHLAALRLAAEAETAIDRERQRRRVVAARGGELTAPSHAVESSDHPLEPTAAELPTAAALTAPSASDEPPPAETDGADTKNLPVPVGTAPVEQRRSGPLRVLPAVLPLSNPLPDITRAVTGMVRPFVPPILARAVGHTQRTLVEEFEEVSISYTRRRTVTVDEQQTTSADTEPSPRTRVISTRVTEPPEPTHNGSGSAWRMDPPDAASNDDPSHTLAEADRRGAVTARTDPRELPPGT